MSWSASVVEEVRMDAPSDFGEWVAARGPALQRFAYLVTGDADEAPDLVQDALARALSRWSRLSRTDTAEAYVRRSIVNASISRWRKQRRLVPVADVEPWSDAVESTASSDADHAWMLVCSLPPAQRAAVVLRFYEDLPFEEIASILGVPSSTARSLVRRAVARLRTRLEEESDD